MFLLVEYRFFNNLLVDYRFYQKNTTVQLCWCMILAVFDYSNNWVPFAFDSHACIWWKGEGFNLRAQTFLPPCPFVYLYYLRILILSILVFLYRWVTPSWGSVWLYSYPRFDIFFGELKFGTCFVRSKRTFWYFALFIKAANMVSTHSAHLNNKKLKKSMSIPLEGLVHLITQRLIIDGCKFWFFIKNSLRYLLILKKLWSNCLLLGNLQWVII